MQASAASCRFLWRLKFGSARLSSRRQSHIIRNDDIEQLRAENIVLAVLRQLHEQVDFSQDLLGLVVVSEHVLDVLDGDQLIGAPAARTVHAAKASFTLLLYKLVLLIEMDPRLRTHFSRLRVELGGGGISG